MTTTSPSTPPPAAGSNHPVHGPGADVDIDHLDELDEGPTKKPDPKKKP